MADETYTTQSDGEMLDAIAFSHYGHTEGKVELILSANPRLSAHDVRLPRGTSLILPDLNKPESSTPLSDAVKLWD